MRERVEVTQVVGCMMMEFGVVLRGRMRVDSIEALACFLVLESLAQLGVAFVE